MVAIAGARKRLRCTSNRHTGFQCACQNAKPNILQRVEKRKTGSASALVALRDVGRSPGGCNGTGHLRKDPVVEEI